MKMCLYVCGIVWCGFFVLVVVIVKDLIFVKEKMVFDMIF